MVGIVKDAAPGDYEQAMKMMAEAQDNRHRPRTQEERFQQSERLRGRKRSGKQGPMAVLPKGRPPSRDAPMAGEEGGDGG